MSYFIKPDYNHKTEYAPRTAMGKGADYWHSARFLTSRYYQYHVYDYACQLFLSNKNLESVADVGCGTAYKMMNMLVPVAKRVLGIDQENIIKLNQERYGKNYFEYDDFDSKEIRVKDKFDVVVCADVIEHLLNPDLLLNYIKNITHHTSTILISTPERDVLYGDKDNKEAYNKDHIREWNKTELMAYLEDSGFEVMGVNIYPAQKFNFTYQYLRMRFTMGKRFNHCAMYICRKKYAKI